MVKRRLLLSFGLLCCSALFCFCSQSEETSSSPKKEVEISPPAPAQEDESEKEEEQITTGSLLSFVFSTPPLLGNPFQWRGFPLLHDIDDNGHLDIVATHRYPHELPASVHIYMQEKPGDWFEVEDGSPIFRCYGCSKIGDLNKDGLKDFVFCGHTSLLAFLANKPLAWDDHYRGGFRRDGMAAHDLGDINGDGNLDVVAVAEGPHTGVHVYFGDGKGAFKENPGEGIPTEGAGTRIHLRDVNGDGFLDIVTNLLGPKVFLGDGGKKWTPLLRGLNECNIGISRDIDAADFNGDGKLDLVVTNHTRQFQGIQVFLYHKDKDQVSWILSNDGLEDDTRHAGVATGDMNGDGKIDIVVSDTEGILTYLGDGQGKWQRAAKLQTNGPAWGIALGDINGDGKLDICSQIPHRKGISSDMTGLLGIWHQR